MSNNTISIQQEGDRFIMKTRAFKSFVILFAFSLLLAACAQAAPPVETGSEASEPEVTESETFLIGMSQANKGEPWRQAMNDQLEAAAAQHPEIKLVFADAAQNNAKQVADVENFILQGVDLLIISPNEATPLTDVVSKAYNEGIPVILLDRRILGEDYTSFIGADNVFIGEQAGKRVATWCAEEGRSPCNVLEIRGLEGTSGTGERAEGFRKGIADNPDVKIIAQQNADWLREKAISVSQSMFQANPDVDVLYAHNDPMAEAAYISAENAGLDLDSIFFVGVDGLPTPDGGIRSVMEGRLDVSYIYPTGGAEAIEMALDILENGATPEKEVTLGTEEILPENAEEILAKFGG
jgi:ribose transport system substrate-binding protein